MDKNWVLIVHEGEHGEIRTRVFGPYSKGEAERYKEFCPVDCEVKQFDDFAELLREHNEEESDTHLVGNKYYEQGREARRKGEARLKNPFSSIHDDGPMFDLYNKGWDDEDKALRTGGSND